MFMPSEVAATLIPRSNFSELSQFAGQDQPDPAFFELIVEVSGKSRILDSLRFC